MKVRDVMIDDAATCGPSDALSRAAQLMWDHDCGFVPVVDAGRLVGVVTDRDTCMAAYTKGAPLARIRVADVMTPEPKTASPDDDLEEVQRRMAEFQVRRLPVLEAGRLVGVVSLNDVARAAVGRRQAPTALSVGRTLAAICRHRPEALARQGNGGSVALAVPPARPAGVRGSRHA